MGYITNNSQPVYNALYYGVVADGVTDDTAAWNALFVTATTAGGGTIVLPAGKTSLCSGVLTPMPFGSSAPSLRITGAGLNTGDVTTGTAVLDLRFNGDSGTHLGKIDCRGVGRLEVDHLVLKSGGTDDFQFFYDTNTTVYLHDLLFLGHSANSGSSCVQDAIAFGAQPGVLADIGTGAADAPFQGYGTVVERCTFNRVRVCVYCNSAANGIVIRDNKVQNTCGGDTTHGAFTLGTTTATLPDVANVFAGNLVEITHYPFAWVFNANSKRNQCVGNSFFDGTTGTNKCLVDNNSSDQGNRFWGSALDGSFADFPDVMSTQTITSGTTFTPTGHGTYLVTCVGGGGGGGGGGTPSSAITQVGSGGGAQGGSPTALMSLISGTTYTVSIGTGGAVTGTTTAGGHAGTAGNAGTATTFAGPSFTLQGAGGAGGFGGGASSTTDVSGGMSSVVASLTAGATAVGNGGSGAAGDGCGGGTLHLLNVANRGGGPLGLGAGGGGAGGQATATLGGGGGGAGAYAQALGGTSGGSGTANGVNGASAAATSYGAGGGGGGAGATASGTGGAGGAGGPGAIFVVGPYPFT